MRICFNQPAFVPWGGFFARLSHADKMFLLDDTLLARGFTYVNRNRFKGPEGEVWVTVPLKRKGRGRQKITELEIDEKERWQQDFLLTLQHIYGKSLYFEEIFSHIKTAIETEGHRFLPMIMRFLDFAQTYLGMKQDIILQSDTGITGKGSVLLVSLAKESGADEVLMPYFSRKAVDWRPFQREKIPVRLLRYDPPQYPQFWGHFLKRLSILDLMFCCGPAGRRVIEDGIYIYEHI
jgi:hypothetical protein